MTTYARSVLFVLFVKGTLSSSLVDVLFPLFNAFQLVRRQRFIQFIDLVRCPVKSCR